MSESFGARLRRRREEQQIALGTIAERTKIKQSLLEALERDDISHWPTGIFRRAFIRAYAHAIALDPDVVVREFFEVFPEPVEVVTPAALAAAADTARGSSAPTRFRSFFESFSKLRRSAPAEESREDAVSPSPSEPVPIEIAQTMVDPGVDRSEPVASGAGFHGHRADLYSVRACRQSQRRSPAPSAGRIDVECDRCRRLGLGSCRVGTAAGARGWILGQCAGASPERSARRGKCDGPCLPIRAGVLD